MKFARSKTFAILVCSAITLLHPAMAWADYDKNYVGDMQTYEAVYEDTLVHLARKHNLGFVELRAANPGIDPWIPGAGTEIILPKRHLLPDAPHKGIVINLPEMRVYSYLDKNEEPTTYAIGIGREGLETPFGTTTIVRKTVGPSWRPTPRMRREDPKLPEVVPPGPENPMGTHALYLGWPEYGIHGTNRPYGIGRRVSSGCIRMYPEAIIDFYNKTPVGTQVRVINQPIKLAWIGNELYIEAQPDIEQAMRMEETGAVEQQKLTDEDMALIIKAAGAHEDKLNWPKIRTAVRERKGYPIRIARTGSDEAAPEPKMEKIAPTTVSYPKKIPRKPVIEDKKEEASKSEEKRSAAQDEKSDNRNM